MALQNANSVAITGGTINGTTVGATTPAAGTFTTVTTPIVGAATGSSTTGLDLNVNSKAQARIVEIGDGTRPLVINGGSSGGSQSPGISAPVNLHLSSGTSARVIFYTNGRSTTQQAEISHTASAVNYHQLTGSATGSGPIHSVAGSDTNIDLNLTTKGTGSFKINNAGGTVAEFNDGGAANPANAFLFAAGAASGTRALIRATGGPITLLSTGTNSVNFATNGSSGNIQAAVSHTASAVNYVQVTGAATTSLPIISAQGSDTNIGVWLTTKGTGSIRFGSNSTANLQFRVIGTNAAVNNLAVTGTTAGVAPSLSAEGSDTNIDLTLTPKGTGNVRFGTYTANMALTIQGYVEIKDSGGTVRRLAVIA